MKGSGITIMMKFDTSRFRNVTIALNTPFKPDGDVDYEATKALTRHFQKKGVKSMYVCGSTGEGFLLDNEERKQIVDTIMTEAGDSMNIIVHVGCPSTRHSAQLARFAEQAGATATSAVPSVYYRPGEEGVFRHWTAITEAADLPFFIYNIPQLTGFNLSMDLFNKMLENERVAGIKCSSEPVQDIMRFKQAGGEDFIVFNGPDEQYLAGRIMGADAGIGGTYGAMPELFLKLDELINRGEFNKAYGLQATITEFIYRLLRFPSLYGAVKTLIGMDGCRIGDPRLPFLPVSEKDPAIISLYSDIQKAVDAASSL